MAGDNYTELFERLFDAVVVTDHYGFVVYANPSAHAMLGYAPGELLNKPLTDLIPERLRRAHDAGFERYFGGGEPRLVGKRPVQLHALRTDGSEIEVEISLSAMTDDRGNGMVVGVLRDLSERHAFERELRVTAQLRASVEAAAAFAAAPTPEELYQTVVDRLHASFDTVSARIWLVDGEMMHAAAAAGPVNDRSYSTTPVSMVTHPFRVAQTARDRRNWFSNEPARDDQLDADWMAEHGVVSVAMLPLVAGGRLYGVLTHYGRAELLPEVARAMEAFAVMVASALRDHEQVARLAANHASADLLARASKLLGSSLDYEKTLAALADVIVHELADWCAIHVIDENNQPRQLKVAHVDPARVEWVAEMQRRYPPIYERDQGIGRVMHTQTSEFVPDVSPEMIAAALANMPPRPDGVVIEHDEALELLSKLDLRSYLTVPLVARGRSIGAMTVVRGSERPRFRREDLDLIEDLARRAAYAIDNAQLYHSATEAIRVRDHFMGLASHELRTPITVVLGAVQSLERLIDRTLDEASGADSVELETAKLRSRLRMVDDASRNLAKLSDRMLDVTRLQRGVLQISRGSAEIVSLTRDVIASAELRQRHGHTRDDVTITAALPAEPVTGHWDADRIEQVLNNLLDNGIKYSRSGGSVRLSLTADDERVRVEVRDDGIGIAEAEQAHLFEPFSRGSNTADNYPGFGMGLALARSIVEMHGGVIGVESAGVGAGSTFWFELPRQAAEADAAADDAGEDKPAAT